jgi:hypothetical protein
MHRIRSVYSKVIRNSDDVDKLVTTAGFVTGALLYFAVALLMRSLG